MKTYAFYLAIAAALAQSALATGASAATVAAFGAQIQQTSPCGKKCIDDAFAAGTYCQKDDIQCACTSETFKGAVAKCVIAACPSDAAKIQEKTTQLCSSGQSAASPASSGKPAVSAAAAAPSGPKTVAPMSAAGPQAVNGSPPMPSKAGKDSNPLDNPIEHGPGPVVNPHGASSSPCESSIAQSTAAAAEMASSTPCTTSVAQSTAAAAEMASSTPCESSVAQSTAAAAEMGSSTPCTSSVPQSTAAAADMGSSTPCPSSIPQSTAAAADMSSASSAPYYPVPQNASIAPVSGSTLQSVPAAYGSASTSVPAAYGSASASVPAAQSTAAAASSSAPASYPSSYPTSYSTPTDAYIPQQQSSSPTMPAMFEGSAAGLGVSFGSFGLGSALLALAVGFVI